MPTQRSSSIQGSCWIGSGAERLKYVNGKRKSNSYSWCSIFDDNPRALAIDPVAKSFGARLLHRVPLLPLMALSNLTREAIKHLNTPQCLELIFCTRSAAIVIKNREKEEKSTVWENRMALSKAADGATVFPPVVLRVVFTAQRHYRRGSCLCWFREWSFISCACNWCYVANGKRFLAASLPHSWYA